ncbi:MAG: fructosamine kinase family protein [Gammaproteobacteria bacterium]|nr:fructosamine kinase family protein [Gammaproteobacteria bacterium]NIR98214.1 fructosamine kinase family protein [Gammaproteobacteria bacterium]NIT63885.1 fructosamine kinase family protein [Gammaproteobacteria bacterium]NIV20889.1 phosphotransferase [Gammaproteobacteria bacterium]NIY32465.1 phosphotransferase [Gammaproteobacteria bacterium]
MSLWDEIASAIASATGEPFTVQAQRAVGGGCINQAYRLSGDGREYFVKTNETSGLAMFEAEAEGLAEMAEARAIRVPRPVTAGTAGGMAFVAMEYIPMGGRARPEAVGEQLAALHRVTRERFGWHRDNTIGSTPQINTPCDDWVEFWRRHRLGYQLDLAARRGLGRRAVSRGEQLAVRFDALFSDYRPRPSLLHGDLWGGNAAGDDRGNPVIFDPATYHGDREADLAMTELFGGFGRGFHDAYDAAWPLDPGYPVRKVLYNLYHVLNHYNLFGGGYGGQAESMIDRLLGELR